MTDKMVCVCVCVTIIYYQYIVYNTHMLKRCHLLEELNDINRQVHKYNISTLKITLSSRWCSYCSLCLETHLTTCIINNKNTN